MKCPNCNKEINKSYCMFCGYMLDNGNFIDKNKKGDVSLLETYLGYNYDKIVRNKNWIPTLLLGPLYIVVKGFLLYGLFLFFLDCFLFLFCLMLNNHFPLPGFNLILNILLIITNRILWMTLDNLIYVKLLNKKLEKIKEDNPNNYREIIDKMSKSRDNIPGLIAIFCFISLMIILILYLLKK